MFGTSIFQSNEDTTFPRILVATTILFWICRLKKISNSCCNTCKFTSIRHFFLRQLFAQIQYANLWSQPRICTSDIFSIASIFELFYFLKLLCFRLFYAGAVEGQMPEILSMIQVNKMTPAPAVLTVVRIIFIIFSGFFIVFYYGRPEY